MLASYKESNSLEEAMHFSPHQRPVLNFYSKMANLSRWGQTVGPMPRGEGKTEGKCSASGVFQIIALLEFNDYLLT